MAEDADQRTTEMVNEDEWSEVIDRAARFHLEISGAEFLERLNNGEYNDPDDGPSGLMAVLPLVTVDS